MQIIFEKVSRDFEPLLGTVRRPQGDRKATVRRVSPRIAYYSPTLSPRFSEKYAFLTRAVNKFYNALVT